ncbi:hypothetical protein [Ornithinicoccus halotolerans]|uniref:hypothetical protein n=1 Tax=Ornithinicoccus halotolerans TaxID=1748220 RepID=UPI0012979C08|nr:hypothetical protein [Ornithinicoccus halotolerans]
MKKQYLTSRRGLAYLACGAWVSVALGATTYGRENIVLALLTALAAFAALTLLSYGLFIVEVRTNSLVKSGRRRSYSAPPRRTEPAPSSPTAPATLATAGRAAALPVVAEGGQRDLWERVNRHPGAARVAGVLSPTGLPEAAAVSVDPLVPGYAAAQLEGGGYQAVLIDRSALHDGPWRGTESAAGVDLARQLADLAVTARRAGVPVLMIDTPDVADVNTDYVKGHVDVLFPVDSADFPPEGAAPSALMASLQALATDRFGMEQSVG